MGRRFTSREAESLTRPARRDIVTGMTPPRFSLFAVPAPPPVDSSPAAAQGPGDVELWLCTLDELLTQRSELEALLDADERARCARLVREADRVRYACFHGAVRRILAGPLAADPAALSFVRGPQGKPALGGSAADAGLAFNLSHSGDRLALACGRGVELGVDVEAGDPRTDVVALAARFYHPRERDRLAGLPEAAQRAQFLRWWTAREAWVKARGLGLFDELDALDFSAWTDGPWRGLADEGGARWLAWSFGPAADWAGTLVMGPAARRISRRAWPPA